MLSLRVLLFAGFLSLLPAVQAGVIGATAIPPPPACTPTPKAIPPATLHCGRKHATLSNARAINTPTATSLSDCATQCLATSGCISFGFDASSGDCPLLSSTLKAQGWKKDPASSYVYYSIKCWACPPKPYNGDFETGTTVDWSILYQAARTVGGESANFSTANPGFDGSSYAGQLSTSQGADSPYGAIITIGQTIKTLPNTAYLLSFAYNAIHTSQSSQVGTTFFPRVNDEADMTILAGQDIYFTGTQPADTAGNTLGTWNYYDMPFYSGDNNEVQAAFELYTFPDNTTLLLDDILLTRLTYPNGQYVANGDFDSSSLRPWTVSLGQGTAGLDEVSVSVTSPGQGGDGSAVLLHASRGSDQDVEATLSQQVSVFRIRYVFGFSYQWLDAASGSGSNLLVVKISTSRRTYFQSQILFNGSETDSEGIAPGTWNDIQGQFTSVDSVATISVTNVPNDSTSSRDVIVDNIILTAGD